MENTADSQIAQRRQGTGLYRGEVVYVYAFDLAYDMKRLPVREILSEPTVDYSIGPSKRNPKYAFFYRPQMVVLPPETREGLHGTVEVRRSVKLFGVGAISIQVRVPFEVQRIDTLVNYHDPTFGSVSLDDEIRQLAEKVRLDLAYYCISPVQALSAGEAYTVFCLYELPEIIKHHSLNAEQWLKTNRRVVAGLLAQEEDAAHLSAQEVEESTGRYLSYYYHDLVVADWDAALVIGDKDTVDDVIHIMELANVQLVELSTYDRVLDESLELAYRDMARRWTPIRREVFRKLREIRVDLARFSDELSNFTKFFGDWHLARVYESVSGRFHLADWRKVIDEKLKTLGELYHLLQQDKVNFWMVMLEITIVALFVIDVVLLLLRY